METQMTSIVKTILNNEITATVINIIDFRLYYRV